MKNLSQSSVGTGAGTLLYTVPNGYKTDVESIDIANTTASPLRTNYLKWTQFFKNTTRIV